MKKNRKTDSGFRRWLRCLVILWLFPWRTHKLITANGLVYVVRDGEFREREIQNPLTGQWKPEREVTFSSIPYFEDYHRNSYFAAKPFEENPQPSDQAQR